VAVQWRKLQPSRIASNPRKEIRPLKGFKVKRKKRKKKASQCQQQGRENLKYALHELRDRLSHFLKVINRTAITVDCN
jgi:hypothetical protein